MPRLFLLAICCFAGLNAQAAVIVVTNRARADVSFAIAPHRSGDESRHFTLASGDVLPIPLDGPADLSFDAAGPNSKLRVVPHGLYYFNQPKDGPLDLGQIGLSTEISLEGASSSAAADESKESRSATQPSLVIPVKILFDNAEVHRRDVWERRMRARFDEASRIFKKHCFVEFKIVAVESWHSDGATASLEESLSEFERLVAPAPARLAVGFSGHLKPRLQDRHLGGTRGPLHTHLLIRERVNNNSEPERLEVLVHELGHFLGAVHSPESNSVMRPALGDRQARRASFHVGFDPLNTMAMCLMSEQLQSRPGVALPEMPLATRAQLVRIYVELARAVPGDPCAVRYLNKLGVTIRQAPATEQPK